MALAWPAPMYQHLFLGHGPPPSGLADQHTRLAAGVPATTLRRTARPMVADGKASAFRCGDKSSASRVVLGATAAASAFVFSSRRAPVYGSRGMVATSQPLASEAGIRTLQAGGSAADACVAAAAALNVTEPCSTGIGGDAFALFYNASSKRVECLQGCGRSPAALTLDAVLKHPDMVGQSELPPLSVSALTVTVPGAAAAWEAAVDKWGRLSLSQVLGPAIELAEEGFPVAPSVARAWQASERSLRWAARGQPTPFLPGDRAPREGEIFRNPDLG
eukprot:CAMPEP_0115323896 /NCGR_PEP_ID=MMETSP0270-20121206/82185_1 /TAXON_ID=71861 /ORGANISM="Scrippsiella trochoidea, Strain CCMP3099" /LENGTH=275 /DNA_ID=CAMNT_0002743969 /DNA_START=6 /DNA_END=829 /DNA_ORIENTATION=+